MAFIQNDLMQHESELVDISQAMRKQRAVWDRAETEHEGSGPLELNTGTEVLVTRRKRKKKVRKGSVQAVYSEGARETESATDNVQSDTIHIPEWGSVRSNSVHGAESAGLVTHGGDAVNRAHHTHHTHVHAGIDSDIHHTHHTHVHAGIDSDIEDTYHMHPTNKRNLHVRIDPSTEDITKPSRNNKMAATTEKTVKHAGGGDRTDEPFSNLAPRNGKLPHGETLVQQKVKTESITEQKVEPVSSEGDDKFLEWVKAQFINVAGEDNTIDLEEFKQALGIKNNYFAERFFDLFDKEGSKTIELSEFVEGMTLLTKGSAREKLKFLFDAYDVDGNGSIDPDELKTVMKNCIEESALQLSEEALEALTLALFEHADADGSGMISFKELCDVLEKHPDVMNNLTISAANWMKPPKSKSSKKSNPPDMFTRKYWVNNKKSIAWVFVYIFVNIGLFLTCIRYRDSNAAVIIARGCGMCLNFNCAFVLVLMLKNTLTLLRMTPLAQILPIDHNVAYHRTVGYIIVVLALVHTVAHYVNVGLVLNDDISIKYWEYVFTLKAEVGYVGPGFAYLSGFILIVILIIMFICALPFIRSKGYFQVFYFTHLLYLAFWVLLILHGPIFGYFFVLPGFIFILEKTIPPFLRRAKGTTFHIKKVALLPSKVTHLVIGYSGSFHFKPGDYVLINIPCIAKFEFHPFTISSAPEKEGEFWLHVRGAGHWTKGLYKYFEDYHTEDVHKSRHSLKSATVTPSSDIRHSAASHRHKDSSIDNWRNKYKTKEVNIPVSIRGPYGTPTREIFETEHAILVASGIGVTPFASILQSISYRVRAAKKTCPHCTKTFLDQDHITQNIKLKKVDFLWINREQKSFEWFVSLLQQLEEEEAADSNFDHFLDMQMYMTSALSMNDMKGFGLQVALDAMQKKGQRNVVTGLRSSLKPGRPNWQQVFSTLKAQNKGEVKVFFCGNPTLAKVLKTNCDHFGFAFSKETF